MKVTEGSFRFDPIVPFLFIKDKREDMMRDIRRMKREFGVSRILIVFPVWYVKSKSKSFVETCEEFGEMLAGVNDELKDDGIEAGWWCAPTLQYDYCSANACSDLNQAGDFQKITGIDGYVAQVSNCPLDVNFQKYFRSFVGAVVSKAKPKLILMEDDFALSNKGKVRYGCFCPLHLERFAQKVGRMFAREELESLFGSGTTEAAQYRRLWADLSRESLAELAREIREEVDIISPETRIGFCQPGPCDADGNITESVAKAFAGKTRPLVRLAGSDYYSDNASGFAERVFRILHHKQYLPDGIELIIESDTYPHTRFFMSAVKMRAFTAIAMLYGLDGSLFYAAQYLDSPLEEEGYFRMLNKSRDYFTQLKKAVEGHKPAGINVLYEPLAHVNRKLYGPYIPYSVCPGWITILGRFGIPYTANSSTAEVTVMCGEDVLELDDAEVKMRLSRGVFLDGVAARHLCDRGYGHLLGVAVSDMPKEQKSKIIREILEEDSEIHGNIDGRMMYSCLLQYEILKVEAAAGSRVISSFADEDGNRIAPETVLYENELGGKIAVISYDLLKSQASTLSVKSPPASILNYKRKEQFRRIFEWMAAKKLPVYAPNDPGIFLCVLESETKDSFIVAVFNLCLDDMEEIILDVDENLIKMEIQYLEDNGEWSSLENGVNVERDYGNCRISVKKACRTLRPAVLKFRRARVMS